MPEAVRGIFDRIGRPNAFSWQVAAIAVFPSIVLVLAGPWTRAGGSPLPWIVIAVLSNGIATVAMVPFRLTVLRSAGRPSRPILTLFAFALAGVIRGVSIGQIAFQQGMLPTSEAGHRVVSGALAGVVYLSIIALMVQSVLDHADSTRRLAAERARLAAATAKSRSELERITAEIVERVRSQMIGRLSATVAGLEGERGRVADGARALSSLIDGTLKPLVDEITSRSALPQPLPVESEPAAGGMRGSLFSDATTVRPISPLVTATALSLAGSVSFVPLIGLPGMLLGGVLVWLGLALMFRLSMLVMRPASGALGPVARAVVLTLLLEISGLATTAIVVAAWDAVGLDLEPRIDAGLLAASPLVVVLVGWGIAITAAWDRRAHEIGSETAAAVESLRTQEANLARELAVERDRLARFVHGPVQDHLIAAWTLLERGGEGRPGDRELGEAATLIGEAIELLEERIMASAGSPAPAATVEDLVRGYATVWDGLVEISCVVEEAAQARLSADHRAAGAVGEVIREAIANAARHARSEAVRVSVACGEMGTVVVTVDAEGSAGGGRPTAAAQPRRRGLGSETLDQFTSSWQLEVLERGSRLTAVVTSSG